MKTMPLMALAACLVAGGSQPVLAGDTGRRVGDTVEESVKTGGRAARDGALTFGRTTRDFFTGGPDAARRTWDANARRTKENARAGGRATRDAAQQSDTLGPDAE